MREAGIVERILDIVIAGAGVGIDGPTDLRLVPIVPRCGTDVMPRRPLAVLDERSRPRGPGHVHP